MNSPRMTSLNRVPMTSKFRFLGDGTADVHAICYFSQLSSTFSPPFRALKPEQSGTDLAFRPSIDPPRQNEDRPATTVQLLTKKRSIFLAILRSISYSKSRGNPILLTLAQFQRLRFLRPGLNRFHHPTDDRFCLFRIESKKGRNL